jgi:hypothetical protein
MKLISMTDFVLEQNKLLKNAPDAYDQYCKMVNYANFLKQPLKLEMFVPCDEDSNVLEEPIRFKNWKNYDYSGTDIGFEQEKLCRQYHKAQEKVLFEGWFIHFEDCVFKLKDGCFSIIDLDSNYTIEDFCENEEESRILTKNALKQLGL